MCICKTYIYVIIDTRVFSCVCSFHFICRAHGMKTCTGRPRPGLGSYSARSASLFAVLYVGYSSFFVLHTVCCTLLVPWLQLFIFWRQFFFLLQSFVFTLVRYSGASINTSFSFVHSVRQKREHFSCLSITCLELFFDFFFICFRGLI